MRSGQSTGYSRDEPNVAHSLRMDAGNAIQCSPGTSVCCPDVGAALGGCSWLCDVDAWCDAEQPVASATARSTRILNNLHNGRGVRLRLNRNERCDDLIQRREIAALLAHPGIDSVRPSRRNCPEAKTVDLPGAGVLDPD